MKNMLISALTGPLGDTSIKRIMAIMITISLIVGLFIEHKFKVNFDPNMITSLTWIDGICIAGTAAEKFSPQIKYMGEKLEDKDN